MIFHLKLACCIVLFLASTSAAAVGYRVTNLGPALPQGYGLHINDMGQIAGTVIGAAGFGEAALWSGGTWRVLEPGIPSSAHGLNDHGHVVGSAGEQRLLSATVWRDGGAWRLPAPDGGLAEGMSINNSGQVAGWISFSDAGRGYAAWWDEGEMRMLSAFGSGAAMGVAHAINERAQIAGMVSLRPREFAARWDAGEALLLSDQTVGRAFGLNNVGTAAGYIGEGPNTGAALWGASGPVYLNDPSSAFYDINDAGTAIGVAGHPGSDARYAMLFEDGIKSDLNGMIIGEREGLGTLVWATAINHGGQIVGMATLEGAGADATHGFLLTPVPGPEPAHWTMLLGGLGMVGLAARRRASRADRPARAPRLSYLQYGCRTSLNAVFEALYAFGHARFAG